MLSAELDGPFCWSLEDKSAERNVDGGFGELTRGHQRVLAKSLLLFCHVVRT